MNLQHPPAIVRSAADLRLLAQEINSAHKAAEDHGRKTLEHFKELGEKLIKAKEQVPHGQFGAWVNGRAKSTRPQQRRGKHGRPSGRHDGRRFTTRRCWRNSTG
jgi:Protein of unknown function (DUF3102)